MSSTAFVSVTPVLARATPVLATSTFTARRQFVTAPARRSAAITMLDDQPQKIPQGFTTFSEQLNGRAAMMGFAIALLTEAITGKGIIAQVTSIFDIVSLASTLGN